MKFWKLASVVTALVLSTSANASFLYTYTGNQFNTFEGPSLYDNTMSVNGSIELEFALGANLVDQTVSVLSSSFNDGVNTIENSINSFFRFSTDTTGTITDWWVTVGSDPSLYSNIGDSYMVIGTSLGRDSAQLDTCDVSVPCFSVSNPSSFTYIENAPGSWAVSAVPVPAAVWLFGSGLIGLAGIARRKKA